MASNRRWIAAAALGGVLLLVTGCAGQPGARPAEGFRRGPGGGRDSGRWLGIGHAAGVPGRHLPPPGHRAGARQHQYGCWMFPGSADWSGHRLFGLVGSRRHAGGLLAHNGLHPRTDRRPGFRARVRPGQRHGGRTAGQLRQRSLPAAGLPGAPARRSRRDSSF